MRRGANEAFSRVLIDKALEFSGWNLLDAREVRFELNMETGRADYVLSGQRGPLCVLEAKREDVGLRQRGTNRGEYIQVQLLQLRDAIKQAAKFGRQLAAVTDRSSG